MGVVALEVEVLKVAKVVQEEKGEGSPGEGGWGRSCLGFASLRERGTYRHRDTQETGEIKTENESLIIHLETLIL